MDKTIKINLGGTLFQIDEDAYKILRNYLQEIDTRIGKTTGGAETLEDIELRIAEIFQSQKGIAGVISKENVEAMISIIGRPEDFDIPGEGEEERTHTSYRYTASSRKLFRNPDDKIISGVSSGIGAYLNIEPVWIRIMFIILTCFFFVGLFVYIALWIALPAAVSDAQKREMFGGRQKPSGQALRNSSLNRSGDQAYGFAGTGTSSVGNAFNEVFKAIGKVFYIAFRIILIIIGICFVITGFVSLVSFIMVFFLKYPGYFSTDSFDVNLFYLPDFLNYIVTPAVAPWILVLGFIVVLMPLLALIYWGIKMIFWFKAKDGVFALVGFILWIISVAALSLILFNEGFSFAESAKSLSTEVIEKAPSDLYILSGKTISGLNYDKDISVTDEGYDVYVKDDSKDIFIGTRLKIYSSDNNSVTANIRKRSMGRSRTDASRKAEGLVYNYKISGDTIFLDEYFTIPAGNKWTFDNVGVNLRIPEGTVVHFDENTLKMYNYYNNEDNDRERDFDDDAYYNHGLTWNMTSEGLVPKSDSAEERK